MTPAGRSRHVPGARLRALVSALFDQATADRVLLPAIADLQHEVAENNDGSLFGRALVRLRAYAAFWRALVACLVLRRSGDDGREWARTVVGAMSTLIVVTALLMYGPARRLLDVMEPVSFMLLLPQALAVSIPCSVLGAGLLRGARATSEPGSRTAMGRAVLGYSLVAVAASFVVMVWAVPSCNQAYRQRIYVRMAAKAGRPLSPAMSIKGYPEMTVSELLEARNSSRFDFKNPRSWRVERERAGYYLHLKGAVPAASLALGLMTIALSPRKRGRWLSPIVGLVLAIATLFVYYLLLFSFRELTWAMVTPAWIGAWGPPLYFSVLALLVLWRRLGEQRRGAERIPAATPAS
jgi:hypothetical protein